LLVGLGGALSLVYPYITGSPERVLDAGIGPDGLVHWIYTSDGNHTFNSPAEPPLSPAVTSDGKPTLLGHQVLLADDRIVVVRHWSVAFNLAAYTIVVSGLILYAVYKSKGGAVKGYGEG